MAFLWQAGTGMQDLGFVPGDTDSRARAINDRGQIVGYVGVKEQVPVWGALFRARVARQ
jgi:uncharacterized membrane protein